MANLKASSTIRNVHTCITLHGTYVAFALHQQLVSLFMIIDTPYRLLIVDKNLVKYYSEFINLMLGI